MKSRLLQFIDRLRAAGLRITPAETLDAARALAIVGIEATGFREAAAATLVKDEADRATFDDEFDRFFAVPGGATGKRKRNQPAPAGDGAAKTSPEPSGGRPGDKPPERDNQSGSDAEKEQERNERSQRRRRMAYLRGLQDVPLKDLTARQIEDCDALLDYLAQRLRGHMRRRQRLSRRGRLDLRRTIRRSISSGGVPVLPQYRRRRPGKPDLIALCDMSYSVAVATRFLLALLGPAPQFFRRVRLFGYVDAPTEIWLQDGQVVQDGVIDLYARSDFGKVLTIFSEGHARLLTRNTLLLILGDARNNRRPPRADLLARAGSTVRQVVWLNPEMRERWDTGDSVLSTYVPACDVTLGAATLRQLYLALRTISR